MPKYNSVYLKNEDTSRKRGFPLIRLLLIIFAVVLVWKLTKGLWFSASQSQSASVLPTLEPVNRQIEQSIQKVNFLTRVVKPGDTFDGILSGFEITQKEASDIYNSLKPIGLPPLYPGDSLIVIKKDQNGELKKIALLSRMKYWYKVTRNDSLIRAEKSSIQISKYTCLVNGVLETSLSEQVAQYGVGDYITSKLADIFAWDINFFLDPRKGDTFQILFEQKYAEGHFVGYGDILAAHYNNNGKDYYAFAFTDENGAISYYDEKGNAVQKEFLKAPLKFSRISSGFSLHRKHPILGIIRPHLGVDYAAPAGTPVYAAADGSVISAGPKGGFGNLVVISHGYYETSYGHLSHIASGIHYGSRVMQGDMIGTVGATGLATGPHLDYRMKRGSVFVNPMTVSLPSKRSIGEKEEQQFMMVKEACQMAFDKRFSHQTGCHIIEIEKGESEKATVNEISSSTDSINGNTPGS
jgi:murein DD-endopeptidase MepM/ murein hydrolase activator NlpD